MQLNSEQIISLKELFIKAALNINDFIFKADDYEICFYHKIETNYRFQIRNTIGTARFCDVFCEPYTYIPHIYMECNSFTDCLELARVWATVTRHKLEGRKYYSKIFISHAFKDKDIIDEFVDKFLRLSCGYEPSDIVYTSRQTTGVEPGDGIPFFIKDNIYTSDLILFMISTNYKKSEVCMNEMGAAWALDKQTVPILLPNISFNKIGWLTSLNKAIKIDDSEGLDKLFIMLSRDKTNAAEWNIQRKKFLKFCSEIK